MNKRLPSSASPRIWPDWFSIAFQLRAGIVLLVATVLLLTGGLLIYSSFQVQLQQLEVVQQERSHATASAIDAYLDDLQRKLSYLARVQGLTEFSPDVQQRLLGALTRHHSAYEAIAILDNTSRVISSVSPYQQVAFDNWANSSWFLQAIKQQEEVISPVEIDRTLKQPVVTFAIPIRNQDDTVNGVLIARINLKFLGFLLHQTDVGKTGYAYIIDPRNFLIAAKGNTSGLSTLQDLSKHPFIQNFTQLSTAKPLTIYQGLKGVEVIGSIAPIRSLRWKVIVELPTAEAYAPVRYMLLVMGVALVLAILVAAGLGMFFARRIVQPLQHLTHAAAQISAGNLDTVVSVKQRNELGALATTFNHMTAQLGELIEELTRNEERFRLMVEGSEQVFFYLHDNNHVFEYISPSVKAVLGYEPEELVGKVCDDIVVGELSQATAIQLTENALLTGQRTDTYIVLTGHKDGRVLVTEVSETPLVRNGQVVGMQGFIRDITQRHQALEQLRITTERERLLGEMALRIRTSLDLEQILNNTVTEVRQFLQADRVLLYRFEEVETPLETELRAVVFSESFGLDCSSLLGLVLDEQAYLKEMKTIYGQGLTQVFHDLTIQKVSPLRAKYFAQFQVRASLSVPILLGEQLFGVVVAQQCSSVRQWQPFEIELLEKLAIQVGLAIQQAKLYEEVQRLNADLEQRNQELERRVAERTAHLESANEQLQIEIAERRVTEEKLVRAYHHLHESERQFRTLVSNIPGAVYQCGFSPDWPMAFISEAIMEICGYPASDFINNNQRSFDSIIHPDDRASVYTAACDAIATKTPYILEYRMIHADGSIRWVYDKGQGVFADNEELLNLDGAIFDITERKRVQEALRESEQRYRSIVENASDFISVLSLDGKYLYASPNCPRLLGYEVEEIIGKEWAPLIHPEDLGKLSNFNQKLIKTGESLSSPEYRFKHKDGSWRWCVSTASCVKDTTGNPLHIVAISRDVTERVQAEEELRQAKVAAEIANQAKSEFLANMSHELRTPLNGILGYAQILQNHKNLTPQQQDGIGIIQQSGEHLLTLINDILDLSKIEAGKMELHESEFCLPNFLKGIVEMFRFRAQQKDLAFLYESLSPLPKAVRGDEQKLRQILINLLGNAVKFTEIGGVAFKVGCVPLASSQLSENPNQQTTNNKQQTTKIRFQVEDTGIGIAPEKLEEIFLPFQQGGAERHFVGGTGLGLPISKRLAEMMGSCLNVSSKPGEGSIFWLELSLPEITNWQGTSETQQRTITGFVGKPRKMLVADDKWENRSVLVSLLSPLGFEMMEATNGEDCLRKAAQFKPDVVLMDLVMPVLDGFEATRQLRKVPAYKDMVVIAASASAFEHDHRQSLTAGCNDFISKPIHTRELLEKLQRHLQLEWVYESIDSPSVETVRQSGNIDSTAKISITVPSDEEIKNLYRLALIGDVIGLQKQADILEQHSEEWMSFATELRQLAKSFQVKKLQEFIRQYMNSNE